MNRLPIKQEDITLANVRVNNRLSEETVCFSADLKVRGVKVAEVANRGHGGCNEYYWTSKEGEQALNEWVDAQTVVLTYEGESFPLKHRCEKLDHFIGDLVAEAQTEQALKRHCAKKTLFRLKGEPVGEWHTVKMPFSPAVEQFITKKYGDKVELIANKDIAKAVPFA